MNLVPPPHAAVLVLCATLAPAQDRGGGGKVDRNEDLGAVYFTVCDDDANGWISFAEASARLRIDREAFAVYDQDVDGRISRDEFLKRYQTITSRGGSFPAPSKKRETTPARRSGDELLETYDKDGDDALDAGEIDRALADYEVRELDGKTLVAKLDRDATAKVERRELDELARVLSPVPSSDAKPVAGSIEELFGKKVPLEDREGLTQGPAMLPGPTSAFRRLDFDQDGRITARDLTELQRPILVPIRVNAVIATLDRDGDGAISREELESSMRVR